jgi:signal transduction histidine kinase
MWKDRVFSLDAEGLYGEKASENFLGTQGIARDITERIKREEEREKLTKQLHESQRLEAIGTLAGGIAHDFNNILAGMIGYAELAMADLPKDSRNLAKCLERILFAGDRAKTSCTADSRFQPTAGPGNQTDSVERNFGRVLETPSRLSAHDHSY